MNESRRNILFPNVSDQDWNDWHWQVRNRIETLDELKKYVQLTEEEQEGVRSVLSTLRMAITPYYLSLINPDDPHDPIRKQCIPTAAETHKADADLLDPLHEDEDSPVPGLTHRYPDRVLFLITDMCSMYCRHCTRRRFAGQKDDESPLERIEKALAYIEKTECVRDVLLSGGDALMVSDKRLEYIISRLRAIPHVEIVRIGSRVPVVCPQRITPELCAMLSKYHPIWLNTHFNHPNEVTQESRRACEMLANAGIPLGNQSVLLRGINDCVYIQRELVHELVKMRVRPYYLYQCDLSMGLEISVRPSRRVSRSSKACAAIPPVTACPPSWWTPRAVVARHPSCRSISSRRLPAAWCCVTSKASSRPIPSRPTTRASAIAPPAKPNGNGKWPMIRPWTALSRCWKVSA